MTYYQITSEERYTIAALRREGFCSAEIARRLGRHRSTIWRCCTALAESEIRLWWWPRYVRA